VKLDSTRAAALRNPHSTEAIAALYLSLVEPDPAGELVAKEVRDKVRALLGLKPGQEVSKSLGPAGRGPGLWAAEKLAGLEVYRTPERDYLKARWK